MELATKFSASMMTTILPVSILLAGVGGIIYTNKVNMEQSTSVMTYAPSNINGAVQGKKFPVIETKNQYIRLNAEYDPYDWIKVMDEQDGDITKKASIYGTIDNKKKGVYEIRYSVRNSLGLKSTEKIKVIVD